MHYFSRISGYIDFSIADIWLASEKNDLIRRHGNYHIILHDVYENNVETIPERKDVSALSWYDKLNAEADEHYDLSGKNAVLINEYASEAIYGHVTVKIV